MIIHYSNHFLFISCAVAYRLKDSSLQLYSCVLSCVLCEHRLPCFQFHLPIPALAAGNQEPVKDRMRGCVCQSYQVKLFSFASSIYIYYRHLVKFFLHKPTLCHSHIDVRLSKTVSDLSHDGQRRLVARECFLDRGRETPT